MAAGLAADRIATVGAGQAASCSEARSRRQAHDAFELKAQEISQRLAGQAPDARIVSEAVPPGAPAFPKPGTFMSVGGSVGLLLAGLFVWFTEARDRSVRTASALEGGTGLVTGAMVPQRVRKAERLRPHDVALASADDADLALEVDFVETMGPDVHVHAELAGAPFVIVLPGAPKIERGAPLSLRVTALHLFDAQTGTSLS